MQSTPTAQRILGIDPGSLITGVGIVDSVGDKLKYVFHDSIRSNSKDEFPDRLRNIYTQVQAVVTRYQPTQIAIEQVFMHRNADSALKLGQARAAAMSATFQADIPVHEYAAKLIKQAVVGKGAAAKEQVQHMVGFLLQLSDPVQADAADALAVAICHANMYNIADRLNVKISTIRKRKR
ncbi:MAG: crossover junction endodeoxyribonuclease RuvC [Gammaproteobacteria bacterium]|nr:crossover junction endodeoxyribonuclease RuvC [Gammaproteobacteria bacterium]NNC97162.1 crossover junction endodeoxyribonuclease RuvC [Gammaproteobacteria bacterium]NNM13948.1 crossover junction endodeoxyribonuclease RuvC [Gammaproteobacteria bacterium]